MAVTLQQIAEFAGVSRGTVDRALHNRGRVNPEVAARIRKIADELGYRYHMEVPYPIRMRCVSAYSFRTSDENARPPPLRAMIRSSIRRACLFFRHLYKKENMIAIFGNSDRQYPRRFGDLFLSGNAEVRDDGFSEDLR